MQSKNIVWNTRTKWKSRAYNIRNQRKRKLLWKKVCNEKWWAPKLVCWFSINEIVLLEQFELVRFSWYSDRTRREKFASVHGDDLGVNNVEESWNLCLIRMRMVYALSFAVYIRVHAVLCAWSVRYWSFMCCACMCHSHNVSIRKSKCEKNRIRVAIKLLFN